MGSAASTHTQQNPRKSIAPKFHVHDLRAPAFFKRASEKFDPKANAKYCSPRILENVMFEFKKMDVDGSGDISFNEFKASKLAENMDDDLARKIFDQIDLNKDRHLELNEFQEFRTSHKSDVGDVKEYDCTCSLSDLKG